MTMSRRHQSSHYVLIHYTNASLVSIPDAPPMPQKFFKKFENASTLHSFMFHGRDFTPCTSFATLTSTSPFAIPKYAAIGFWPPPSSPDAATWIPFLPWKSPTSRTPTILFSLRPRLCTSQVPCSPSPWSWGSRSECRDNGGNGASIIHMPLSVTTGPALALPPCRILGSGEPRVMSILFIVGAAKGAISIGIVFHEVSSRGCSFR